MGPVYEPIVAPPPPERYERELARFDRVQARWALLREALGERWTALASRDEERRAAVETGAIEGLYHLDEGVTQTLIREGLDSEAGRALEQETFDLIAAQQHAIDLVTGSVVRDEPVTVSLIRELHQAVTAGQATYVARDQFGRQFRRELRNGEWKDQDNSVSLPGGAVLDFAPAVQVDAEVDRLVAIIAELDGAPWAYRGAVAHHLLTHIHPFADGNGRTARLLATHQFLRGGLPGFVIETAERARYLDALNVADRGDLSAFLHLLFTSVRVSLRRIERESFRPRLRHLMDPESVASALRVLREAPVAATDPAMAVRDLAHNAASYLGRRLDELLARTFAEEEPPAMRTFLAPMTTDFPRPWKDGYDFYDHGWEVRIETTVESRPTSMTLGVSDIATQGPGSFALLWLGRRYMWRQLEVSLDDPDTQVVDAFLDTVISDFLVETVR